MQARSLITLMAAVLWLLTAEGASSAETIDVWPAGASQPQVLALQPIARTVMPALRSVPRFNLRLSLSGSGDSYVATGSGSQQVAGGTASLIWQINQLTLGSRAVQGRGKPLALTNTRLDASGGMQHAVTTFPAYFDAGGANLDTDGADYMLVQALTDSLSAGWGAQLGRPIAAGQPAFDANRLITGFVARLVPGTVLAKPLPKGTAAGLVEYRGKQALVARFAGQASLRHPAAGAPIALVVDGFALLDVATGLPIYTDAALSLAGAGTTILQASLDY